MAGDKITGTPAPRRHRYEGWDQIASALGVSVRTAIRASQNPREIKRLKVRYYPHNFGVWAYKSWVEAYRKAEVGLPLVASSYYSMGEPTGAIERVFCTADEMTSGYVAPPAKTYVSLDDEHVDQMAEHRQSQLLKRLSAMFGTPTVHRDETIDANGGGVYLVAVPLASRVKIGWTTNVLTRIEGMSTVCPEPPQLLAMIMGDKKLEPLIHEWLHEHRRHREWFEDCEHVRMVCLAQIAERGGYYFPAMNLSLSTVDSRQAAR